MGYSVNSPEPPHLPDALPVARVVPTVVPTVRQQQKEMFRPDEVPDAELPRPKIALALFVTFLTILAIVASMAVIGYTIILGLKSVKQHQTISTTFPTVPVSTKK